MSIINKDVFWDLISQAKTATNGNLDKMHEWLVNWLIENNDPEQAIKFYEIVHAYEYLAYKYGLWTAAKVMSNGWRSDDGFHYFEGWLIAQGKECYFAALKNPDTLADIEFEGHSEFESIDYIGADVYNTLTGGDFYRLCPIKTNIEKLRAELAEDIEYGEGIEEWHDDDVTKYLPRLCTKYPFKI